MTSADRRHDAAMLPAAIIVAGGRGSRYGSPLKCLAVLPRLVRTLRAAGCTRIVIAGDHAGLDVAGCELVHDARPDSGPLGGIVAGLRACQGHPAAIILPGDQLRLHPHHILRLIGIWRRRGCAVAAAQVSARRRVPAQIGVLGLLPAACWPEAAQRLALGRLGVHRLWRAVGARPAWFRADELADLDRPGDLLKFRAPPQH